MRNLLYKMSCTFLCFRMKIKLWIRIITASTDHPSALVFMTQFMSTLMFKPWQICSGTLTSMTKVSRQNSPSIWNTREFPAVWRRSAIAGNPQLISPLLGTISCFPSSLGIEITQGWWFWQSYLSFTVPFPPLPKGRETMVRFSPFLPKVQILCREIQREETIKTDPPPRCPHRHCPTFLYLCLGFPSCLWFIQPSFLVLWAIPYPSHTFLYWFPLY